MIDYVLMSEVQTLILKKLIVVTESNFLFFDTVGTYGSQKQPNKKNSN